MHLAVVHTAAGSFGRQLGECRASSCTCFIVGRANGAPISCFLQLARRFECRCICFMPAEKTPFSLVCVCVSIRGGTCASLVHICCIRKLCSVPAFSMAHQDTQCAACLLLHFHVSTPCRPLDLQVLYESVFSFGIFSYLCCASGDSVGTMLGCACSLG